MAAQSAKPAKAAKTARAVKAAKTASTTRAAKAAKATKTAKTATTTKTAKATKAAKSAKAAKTTKSSRSVSSARRALRVNPVPDKRVTPPSLIAAESYTKATDSLTPLAAREVVAEFDASNMFGALRDLLNPTGLVPEATTFLVDLMQVALGISPIQPLDGDKRFDDPAWRDNPIYKRIGQAYLAWSHGMDRLADNPNLSTGRRERAAYLARLMTSTLSPTNTIFLNPKVAKRTFESGGMSLVRGMRNLLNDISTNGGLPSSVDTTPFEVGRNLACTPGSVVYREEMFEIIQYKPATTRVGSRPMLLVPPQVNKYYVVDLAPGRSMVEYAVGRGLQTFTVVWRNPRPNHGHWGMDDYLAAQDRAMDVVLDITGSDDLNLTAVCAGGLSSALLLSHLAAQGDTRVNAVTFMITMIDTSYTSLLGAMSTVGLRKRLSKDSDEGKVYDAQSLMRNFAWMRPNDLVYKYFVENWLMGEQPDAFDILAWNADSTNLSSAFDRDMMELFGANAAVKAGGVTALGTPVDLSRITQDAFIVCGVTDHIAPWKPCYQTSQLVGGDCEMVVTSTGHIQTIVNPPGKPRAAYWTGKPGTKTPDEWMVHAEKVEGSWWPQWTDWLLERSGPQVAAPRRLGNEDYPPLEDAPGRYVMEE